MSQKKLDWVKLLVWAIILTIVLLFWVGAQKMIAWVVW